MPLARHDFAPEELKQQLALERNGEPFLVFRDLSGAQVLVELEGERVSVGRHEKNDVALPWDAEASRVHALLEQVGGQWTVIDDRLSTNGTFVNGTRVSGRRRIDDRDLLFFGSTEILFRDPAGAGAETPPVSGLAGLAGVTPAQKRVLVALCRPLFEESTGGGAPPTNSALASQLGLSVDGVRAHMKALFRIFNVHDPQQNRKRDELARRALASGVVSARDLA